MTEDPSNSSAVAALLQRLRDGATPQKRQAIAEARSLGDAALAVLEAGAHSGVREVVNDSLIALVQAEGAGQELLFAWLKDGTLGVTRLVTALKESQFADGPSFLCAAIDAGKLKENQVAEAATYLGEHPSEPVLRTLRACRATWPHLGTILDQALSKMTSVDKSAAEVPEQAKQIESGRASGAQSQKKGCLGVVLLTAALALALLALSGCDDVKRREFGGVIGAVGYPPISGARIEIYEATRFAGFDSTQGLITTGVSDGGGRFQIPISDIYLGRPLLVLARPQAGAQYLDFGAPGSPARPFESPRRPWVAVMRQFQGGDDTVAVNPVSTAAFEALMRLPQGEVGPAGLRFDAKIISGCNTAAGNAFGVYADAGETLPAPPAGAPFVALGTLPQEDNTYATAFTYALLQLAQAANAFAAATTDTSDTALDFYEAMFKDAADGVLDGRYFGADVPFFAQAGAPDVLGRQASGASKLLAFVAANPLGPGDEAAAGAVRGGVFTPAVADIVAGQGRSTGSVRLMRVDRVDTLNYPFSGNVQLTLEGAGFHHTDRFIFRGVLPKSDFVVDYNSVGVDGQILEHSDTRLRLRIPDFAATTRFVPEGLIIPPTRDFTVLSFVLQHRPSDTLNEERATQIIITNDARVTNRTEPLLLGVRVGRWMGGGALEHSLAGNNVFGAGQDPGALTPGADDVYALRLRVVNPASVAVNDLGLDLARSSFKQLGAAVVADVFGGAASNRAVIFESAAGLAARELDLAPGAVGEVLYPFVFLDGALTPGAPVEFDMVLSGVSAGAGNPALATNDVAGFSRKASLAPADPDATPLPASVVVSLPASVNDGEDVAVEIALSAAPRAGLAMRNLRVERLDLVITLDGQTFLLTLTDNFFEEPGPAGLRAASVAQNSTGATTLPVVLTQAAPGETLALTLRTTAGVTGTLAVSVTVTARDAATGTVSTVSDSDSTTVS